MKKTYIEPKNTVVRIKLETMILAQSDPSPAALDTTVTISEDSEIGAREVIDVPDAWDEW